jgi:FkbM family methyltransferase
MRKKKIGDLSFSRKKFITEKIKNFKGQIFLYGASNCAESIFKFLKIQKKKPKQVIVDDKYLKEIKFHGINILNKSDFLAENKKIKIVIGIGTCVPELTRMKRKGYSFFENIGFARGPVIDADYAAQKWGEYVNLYKVLEDRKSKQTLVSFLKSKIYGEKGHLKKIKTTRHFLTEKVVTNTQDLIFCDCGAFDGDSIASFCKAVKYNFNKIYAWEPDKKNLAVLKKRIQKLSHTKIVVFNQCAYDRKGFISFDSLGSSTSFVKKTGSDKVQCNLIDNCCPDSSFIKMDVEGCESNALNGASKTIKKNKPILAIAVYHHRNDILSITKKVLRIRKDYRIFLRAHRDVADDVILYAV